MRIEGKVVEKEGRGDRAFSLDRFKSCYKGAG